MSSIALHVWLVLLVCSSRATCENGIAKVALDKISNLQCSYTFYVPRGAGGQCEGQEVKEALAQLRGTTDTLKDQISTLLKQNSALQTQVAALMEDNGQQRKRILALEKGKPRPCEPGDPGW